MTKIYSTYREFAALTLPNFIGGNKKYLLKLIVVNMKKITPYPLYFWILSKPVLWLLYYLSLTIAL